MPTRFQPGAPASQTAAQKKALGKKQSAAYNGNNAKNMFTVFQKLGHGGAGSLDFNDFITLCGGQNTSEVRQLFGMLDEDHSGSVDIQELGHALKNNPEAARLADQYTGLHDLCHLARGRKKKGHGHHTHNIKHIGQFAAFAKLDSDGNGTLDKEEFITVCVGDSKDKKARADATELFGLLDEDHSGSINCGEIGHALRANKKAEKLAMGYQALHDLVHMAHGRKHHTHKHHDDKKRASMFHKLDANGARRSSAEHLIATKALRCTATAWMLTAAESFAKF